MRAAAICLVSSMAVITACSKAPTAGQTGGASAPSPAPTAAPASPVQAAGLLPHPKAGLWKMSMAMDAGPGIRMGGEICLDAQTEQAAFTAGPQARSKDCSEPAFGVAPGGGVTFDTTCKREGRTVRMHGVATGDFNSAYAMDTTTSMDPAPPGAPAEMKMHMQAQWLGPCRPGQTPGHMSMKMNGVGQG